MAEEKPLKSAYDVAMERLQQMDAASASHKLADPAREQPAPVAAVARRRLFFAATLVLVGFAAIALIVSNTTRRAAGRSGAPQLHDQVDTPNSVPDSVRDGAAPRWTQVQPVPPAPPDFRVDYRPLPADLATPRVLESPVRFPDFFPPMLERIAPGTVSLTPIEPLPEAASNAAAAANPVSSALGSGFDFGLAAAREKDWPRAIVAFLAVDDESPLNARVALELGKAYAQFQADLVAASWFRCYLALRPGAEDTAEILKRIDTLKELVRFKIGSIVHEALAMVDQLERDRVPVEGLPDAVKTLRTRSSPVEIIQILGAPVVSERQGLPAEAWRVRARSLARVDVVARLAPEIDRIARLPREQVPARLLALASTLSTTYLGFLEDERSFRTAPGFE